MRIALVTNAYPPAISGSALTIQRLAHAYADAGHAAAVIAASDRGAPYRQCMRGVEVVRLASISTPGRVGFRFAPGSRSEAVAALRSFDPDILHIHDPFLGGLLLAPPPELAHAPLVFTVNQLPWFVSVHVPNLPGMRQAVEGVLWQFVHFLRRHAQAVIVPSRVIARIIAQRTGLQCRVISNGVDTSLFKPASDEVGERERLQRDYGLCPSLPVILHVGRLDIEKKVEIILRAAAAVMQSMPAQLLIVGHGTERPQLERRASELGIRDRVIFTGTVPPEGDLPGLYRLASVFVAACEIETEGIVLLEASASAVPIVGVRATAMPELVGYAGNGFLVTPRDVEAMADKIAYLLSHPQRAAQIGLRGLRLADHRSLARTVDAHLSLYRELLAGARTPAASPEEAKHSGCPRPRDSIPHVEAVDHAQGAG
jgi:glycosyltransferase involved in cell wall biosynthesis